MRPAVASPAGAAAGGPAQPPDPRRLLAGAGAREPVRPRAEPDAAPAARTVFYLSDGTGLTAEVLGHSLLAQLDGAAPRQVRIGAIDSFARLYAAVDRVRAAREADGAPPIVFTTLADSEWAQAMKALDCTCIDLFDLHVGPLADALGRVPNRRMRSAASRAQGVDFRTRIEAIQFALAHDDGASAARLAEAQVVLVGVSRSGKTPTCLYLAMQHGVKAANMPLVPEDFERGRLPAALQAVRDKLVGLTVNTARLAAVREQRMPGSRYASAQACADELDAAQRMMRREGIRCLDASACSVEELAADILALRGLRRA